MELQVKGGSPIEVSEAVFGREYSEALVHQVVVAYQNAGRSGTKAQKTRSEVTGTTKKFKKQKGGGARHGDYRAPIFVGGGVTFAARPRSFAQKVNKQMYRGAMKAILSELNRTSRLTIVQEFDLETSKTKGFIAKLKEFELRSAVIVRDEISEALYLSARNVPGISVVDVHAMDPVTLVGAKHVLMTAAAVKKVEEWLA
jgi:large subunit ribosomal protein L4